MAKQKSDIEPFRHLLDMDEDIPLHKKGWMIQKIGWTVFTIFLLLVALGLFGSGPLSMQTLSDAGNSVEYERFLRYEAETEVTFKTGNSRGEIKLIVPDSYLEYMSVEFANPTPETEDIANNHVVYTFSAQKAGTIYLTLRPKKWGTAKGAIVFNNSHFNLSHTIYP